jgi:hypothetical protein
MEEGQAVFLRVCVWRGVVPSTEYESEDFVRSQPGVRATSQILAALFGGKSELQR